MESIFLFLIGLAGSIFISFLWLPFAGILISFFKRPVSLVDFYWIIQIVIFLAILPFGFWDENKDNPESIFGFIVGVFILYFYIFKSEK